MKKFLVLLLLVSFATICFAQESKKNDLASLNLKGNVKYIKLQSAESAREALASGRVAYVTPAVYEQEFVAQRT